MAYLHFLNLNDFIVLFFCDGMWLKAFEQITFPLCLMKLLRAALVLEASKNL